MRAELALPEPRAARRAFAQAAPRFAAASGVHDEIRARLLERLDWLAVVPELAVDLGCGVARGALALAERFPKARVLALDSSLPMLAAARRGLPRDAGVELVAGDVARLPFAPGTVDLLLASLVLPWSRPDVFFAEAARTLRDGGVVLFSTLGPDSLAELRRAWAAVDDRIHVHAAFDMHDVGDLALAAGLRDPVLDVDRLTVVYPDLRAAVAELRACGGVNVAAGRRRSLTGARRWRGFAAGLAAAQSEPGPEPEPQPQPLPLPQPQSQSQSQVATGQRLRPHLKLTLEIILGQAFGRGALASERPSAAEVGVPIERIGRARPPAR